MKREHKKALKRAKKRREGKSEKIYSTVGFTMAMDQARKKGDTEMEYALTAGFVAARNDILRMPAGAERAQMVHAQVDDIVTGALVKVVDDKAPSCRAGCDACCHMYVTASGDEADLLVETAERRGIPLDLEVLRKQAVLEDEDFFRVAKADRKCVFLGEGGLCQVYEDRPNACRTYYVVSPPELCDLEQQELKVKRLNITSAEVFATGALSASNPENLRKLSLPAQLLAALKRKGKL